jgi:hypothetical protein
MSDDDDRRKFALERNPLESVEQFEKHLADYAEKITAMEVRIHGLERAVFQPLKGRCCNDASQKS